MLTFVYHKLKDMDRIKSIVLSEVKVGTTTFSKVSKNTDLS